MSDVGSSADSSVEVYEPEENPSFLIDTVDLKRLSKRLNDNSKKAVDVLVKALENEKTALQAAKLLLEFQVEVAKAISTDQMQRLIAQIRLNGPQQKLVGRGPGRPSNAEPESPKVLVDFGTVRSVE